MKNHLKNPCFYIKEGYAFTKILIEGGWFVPVVWCIAPLLGCFLSIHVFLGDCIDSVCGKSNTIELFNARCLELEKNNANAQSIELEIEMVTVPLAGNDIEMQDQSI